MVESDDRAADAGEVVSKLEQLDLDAAAKVEKPAVEFCIWPPSERTRKSVVDRLIDSMMKQTPITKRYGTLLAEEAAVMAKQVEEESFEAVGGNKPVDDEGLEELQLYAKEVSRRMFEGLKARASGGSDLDRVGLRSEEAASTAAPTEEDSSVENDSN